MRYRPNDLIEEVTVANPHLVPRDFGDVLLAVAKDRFDLVDDNRPDTADALVRGTRLAHPGLADKYRQALRQLGSGPARARVCEIAQGMSVHEQDEARAAAIDAGYLPADERDRVVFLYLTEQWERYDAADPKGQLLYRAWVVSAESRDWRDTLYREISDVARRAGRPDPRDRWSAPMTPSLTIPSRRCGSVGGVSGAWATPPGGSFGGSVL